MDALVESPRVRQIRGEPFRRWFWSWDMDLIVWVGLTGAFVGFQLCYDKRACEHAITWRAHRGYDHARVDSGEGRHLCKATPLLVHGGPFEAGRITLEFLRHAVRVPGPIRGFVAERLRTYPVA